MPTPPTPKKGRTRGRKTSDWRPVFLDALRDCGIVRDACNAAGIHRSTAYEERQRNETFAVAWADAEDDSTERMEREAYRRAAEGVDKPVYQGKELVGHIREYSDTLLIFMLKARRPDRYRENVKVEHTGKIAHDLSSMSDEQLRDLAGELDAKRA